MPSKTGTREWATKNVNVLVGCPHDCKYCYARSNALRFKRIKNAADWAKPRLNATGGNVRIKKVDGWVMFPSTHDMVPEFLNECMTAISSILEAGNKVLIVSKPHLWCIEEICARFADFKDRIMFRFTIGSWDDRVLKFWEPGAPTFGERLAALEWAYRKGFRTSVSCEPYLDNDIISLVHMLTPFVTDEIWVGPMNKMGSRVDTTGWSEDDWGHYRTAQLAYSVGMVITIHGALRENPRVRWKDGFRKLLAGVGVSVDE